MKGVNTLDRNTVLQNISSKEKVGGIIWIVVASFQLLIGLTYNWIIMFIGIWNLIIGITRITNAGKMEQRANNIVETYENTLTSLIIFLILNIFIGGIIGVVGAIYDLVVRNYVLNNRNVLQGNVSTNYSGTSNKYEDLEKLMKLKQDGVLTETEFEIEKHKILR